MPKTTKEIHEMYLAALNAIKANDKESYWKAVNEIPNINWFTQSEVDELEKQRASMVLQIRELQKKFDVLRSELIGLTHDGRVAILKSDIIKIFGKYTHGLVDSKENHSKTSSGEVKVSNPSEPIPCPKCKGKKGVPLFDARGNIDGGEICPTCSGSGEVEK